MTEVHRYKVVKMVTSGGNKLTYTPHGPEIVMGEAYDAMQSRFVNADNLRIEAQDMADRMLAQRDEGLAREAELRKQSERLSILAAARLHDLNEIGKEIARAELAFRCALPFVQARCDETDYGDASARTTLEMIKELLKTFETSPGCADGEKS